MAKYGYRQLSDESISARTATPSVNLGERMEIAGNSYLYVYNGASDQHIDIGRGCHIASQSNGYTVDVVAVAPSTLTAHVCLGVCQDATIATGGYGWILTQGKATAVQNKLSLVVTGEAIYMTTSGIFRRLSASSSVPGEATKAVAGRAITAPTATTATGTFSAWIGKSLA